MKDNLGRQRLLFVSRRELPEDVFAVVRLSWFREDGAVFIEEMKLVYEDETQEEMIPQFVTIVAGALKGGADVSILTDIEPDLLGISET